MIRTTRFVPVFLCEYAISRLRNVNVIAIQGHNAAGRHNSFHCWGSIGRCEDVASSLFGRPDSFVLRIFDSGYLTVDAVMLASMGRLKCIHDQIGLRGVVRFKVRMVVYKTGA